MVGKKGDVDPTAQSVTAKRRLLVEGLLRCLKASKVCEVVPVDTVRAVFDSAASELWREGEFRLEVVWKILCQQPGLDAKTVAPPLLALKGFEELLEVRVVLPAAVASIPKASQEQLRGQVDLPREVFVAHLEELRGQLTAAEATGEGRALSSVVSDALGVDSMTKTKPATSHDRRRLAIGLGAAAVLALSLSFYLAFGARPTSFDVSELEPIVRLEAALRQDRSLVARLADPRWETLTKDDQKKLAGDLLDAVARHGIEAVTLKDATDRVRVIAASVGGRRTVVVP
jgi:hypothetical protein